jgi:hypothetical protein
MLSAHYGYSYLLDNSFLFTQLPEMLISLIWGLCIINYNHPILKLYVLTFSSSPIRNWIVSACCCSCSRSSPESSSNSTSLVFRKLAICCLFLSVMALTFYLVVRFIEKKTTTVEKSNKFIPGRLTHADHNGRWIVVWLFLCVFLCVCVVCVCVSILLYIYNILLSTSTTNNEKIR